MGIFKKKCTKPKKEIKNNVLITSKYLNEKKTIAKTAIERGESNYGYPVFLIHYSIIENGERKYYRKSVITYTVRDNYKNFESEIRMFLSDQQNIETAIIHDIGHREEKRKREEEERKLREEEQKSIEELLSKEYVYTNNVAL